jgi:hypothetical protein
MYCLRLGSIQDKEQLAEEFAAVNEHYDKVTLIVSSPCVGGSARLTVVLLALYCVRCWASSRASADGTARMRPGGSTR